MQCRSQGVPKWHANTRKPRCSVGHKVQPNKTLTLKNHAMQHRSQGVPKWHANTGKPRDAASVARSNFKVLPNDSRIQVAIGHFGTQSRPLPSMCNSPRGTQCFRRLSDTDPVTKCYLQCWCEKLTRQLYFGNCAVKMVWQRCLTLILTVDHGGKVHPPRATQVLISQVPWTAPHPW